MKLENDHQLHRDILKIIKEAEINQEWLSDTCVRCKIPDYEAQSTRDLILDRVLEHLNQHYTYTG